jgi:hypothetical protein
MIIFGRKKHKTTTNKKNPVTIVDTGFFFFVNQLSFLTCSGLHQKNTFLHQKKGILTFVLAQQRIKEYLRQLSSIRCPAFASLKDLKCNSNKTANKVDNSLG